VSKRTEEARNHLRFSSGVVDIKLLGPCGKLYVQVEARDSEQMKRRRRRLSTSGITRIREIALVLNSRTDENA
jgi:hypothetical protein